MNLSEANEAASARGRWIEQLKVVEGIVVSPDGSRVVYTQLDALATSGRPALGSLHVIDVATGSNQRIVDGRPIAAAWSPDSDRIAFVDELDHSLRVVDLGDRGPTRQRPIGNVDGQVETIVWSSSGDALVALIAEPGAYTDSGLLVEPTGQPPDPLVRRPNSGWRRLWRFDTAGDAAPRGQMIGADGWSCLELAWSGRGPLFALASRDPSASGWYHSAVIRIDPFEGIVEELYRPERFYLEGLAVNASATRLAVIEGYASDAGLLAGTPIVLDLDKAVAEPLWAGLEDVSHLEFIDDDVIGWSGWDSTGTVTGTADVASRSHQVLWRGEQFLGESIDKACVSWIDADRFVASAQDFTSPPSLVLRTSDGLRTIAEPNRGLLSGDLVPQARTISWVAPDGLAIDGILLLPPAGEDARALPACVVAVHGGPTWAWGQYFVETSPDLVGLAMAGFAVLMPNPRGSNGRGSRFREAVIGDAGGADHDDILAGVRHCADRGLIDPARAGITGLSYGGFMSAWAPTQTDTFKAAVAFSIVADWPSSVLGSDAHDQDFDLLGTEVLAPNSLHVQRSPAFVPQFAPTPTLIIAGEGDRCTPVGQAYELYNKLAREGVETELVVYPREGHVLLEVEHVADATRRTIDWFSRFL